MQIALSQFYLNHFSRLFKREKCICFHCGESMRKEGALTAMFQGEVREVCCHGCLAVLNTIEKNGLTDEYLRAKQSDEGRSI